MKNLITSLIAAAFLMAVFNVDAKGGGKGAPKGHVSAPIIKK